MNATFKPRYARYKERVTESFNMQKVMGFMNVSIVEIRPGFVKFEFPFQECLTQQHGFIHAGVQSTVMDSACGYAALSLMPKNAGVLTAEFKINLLSPAAGERFVAIGRVKKPGKTLTVSECDLFAESNGSQKLISSMVGTLMSIYDQEGIDN